MKFLRNNKLVILYTAFIIAYLASSFMTSINKVALAKYHLSTVQAKVIVLTIAIPYIVIWIISLVGYLRLRTYVLKIKGSKDGDAFKTISYGILWFSLWLPIAALVDVALKHYYQMHPALTAHVIRLDNYINLIVIFLGFLFVYQGTKKLLPIVKKPVFSPAQSIVFIYIVFSAFYLLLTLHDPIRRSSHIIGTTASYYEPDWLLVLTLVIPRLLMWFMGVQAVHNLYIYSQNVKGSLYKTALRNLTLGLAGIVIMTIALRCLQSLAASLNRWNLNVVLVFVYVLLILLSVGYVLVAKGAKNLQKLEEL